MINEAGGIERYKHSGRIDAITIPGGLGGGLVVGIAMAWVYQLAVDWIPIIYLNVLTCVAFGFVLGLVMVAILTKLNCRNMAVAGALGLVVSCAALAASYHWAYVRVCQQIADKYKLTTQQVEEKYPFHEYLDNRVEAGWSVSTHGSPASKDEKNGGFIVWIVWGVEALLIVGIATALTATGINDPFCEDCHVWTKGQKLGSRAGVPPARVKEAIASGSLEAVIAVPGGDPSAPGAVEFSTHTCETCFQQHYLSIAHTFTFKNDKGATETSTTKLLEHALVDQRIIDKLRASLDAAAQATPPAAG